jgi:hypothetical protein
MEPESYSEIIASSSQQYAESSTGLQGIKAKAEGTHSDAGHEGRCSQPHFREAFTAIAAAAVRFSTPSLA